MDPDRLANNSLRGPCRPGALAFRTRPSSIACILGLAILVFSLSGCIGFYGNTTRFLQPPSEGMEEIEMIKQYGEPSFSTVVEDQTVYSYKIRDVKYLVVVGIYKGYDLVIVCLDGRVIEVKKIDRNQSFSLFHPAPWAIEE